MFKNVFAALSRTGSARRAVLRKTAVLEDRLTRDPHYSITFSPAGYKNVQMDWIGVLDGSPLTVEEVHVGFRTWLDTAPVSPGGVPQRTIKAWVRGAYREITFRTDWVSGFSVQRTG